MSREVLQFAVGDGGVKLMSAAFGGSDYRVPTGPGSDAYDRLVAVLGDELALKLVRIAGGDVLYVPRGHNGSLDERNRMIAQMLEQGMTPCEIARKFTFTVRLSERHVYRIMGQLNIRRGQQKRGEQIEIFATDARQDT